MEINTAAITPEMIEAAVRQDDLTEALIPLQDAAGIDTGDLAGVFFSGEKNDSVWRAAAPETRAAWLREYLALEQDIGGDADCEDEESERHAPGSPMGCGACGGEAFRLFTNDSTVEVLVECQGCKRISRILVGCPSLVMNWYDRLDGQESESCLTMK